MFRKRKRIKTRKIAYRKSVKDWRNSLVGYPGFVIGNAPSVEDVDLSILNNYFTIGLNRIFYKFDPTILMWQDIELWYTEKHNIPKTEAIKYCRDKADLQGRFFHFKLKNGPYELPESPEILYGRGSTGPLGFQLAYILGCDPIILIGMDCRYRDSKTDFYGRNPNHKKHTLINCSRGTNWIKNNMKNCGRTIINCSDNEDLGDIILLKNTVSSLATTTPTNREFFITKLTGKNKK